MSGSEVVAEHNLDGYGAAPIEWSRVNGVMHSQVTQAPDTGGPGRHTSWLTTTNPDNSPHVMPVGMISFDDTWFFTSGPGTRKSRNIERDSRCVVSIATTPFDIVVEGVAERVTEHVELEAVAAAFAAQGWSPTVEGDGFTAEFSAPAAGPPPWYVYRVHPSRVYALGTAEPYGATRFDLDSDDQ